MQGARGAQPWSERVAYGERGRGVAPFRSIPPTAQRSAPQLWGERGAWEGAEPGPGEPGTFLGPGPGGGPSVPRGAGWSWRLGSVCVGGGGRGSERIAVWRYWKEMSLGAYTLAVWGGPRAGMRSGREVESRAAARGEWRRRVCGWRGWDWRLETPALYPGAQRTGAGILLSPLVSTRLRAVGSALVSFRGLW